MKAAPESPYGHSKLAAEGYLHSLGAHMGVETSGSALLQRLRAWADSTSDYAAVIPLFITALLADRPPTINGDGGSQRDFIYVDDVASANLLAGVAPGASSQSVNIASGERTSLLELLAAIASATGSRVEPLFGPPRAGDIRDSQADVSLAQAAIGHVVEVSFSEGIKKTVAWYRESRAADG